MANTIKKIKVNNIDYNIDASYLGGYSSDEYLKQGDDEKYLENLVIRDDDNNYSGVNNFPENSDIDTTYYSKGIKIYDGNDVNPEVNISFPNKSGTFALTSDIPNGILTTDNIKSNIINLIYPVGSIYMSVNNVSPASFLGGTWEALKDRFLIGAGNTYSVNSTGGSTTSSYTLTSANIPAHSHSYTVSGSTSAKTVTAAVGGQDFSVSGYTGYTQPDVVNYSDESTIGFSLRKNGSVVNGNYQVYIKNLYENQMVNSGYSSMHKYSCASHSHSYNISGTTNAKSISLSVGGQSFSASGSTGIFGQITPTAISVSTMSPYLAVYMWKRTA